MKIAISTASAYSDSIKLALESVGEEVEIMNSWGESKGLFKIVKNPNSYKVLLLQWPEALLNSTELFFLDTKIVKSISNLIGRISSLGVKVIFTFHNLIPHEYSSKQDIGIEYYNSILAYSSIILHHSNVGFVKAQGVYPIINRKKNSIFRHPPYFFINQYDKDWDFIQSLHLDPTRRYFLSIGSIAEYKNIDIFLTTLNSLSQKQYGLIIAGKSYDSLLNIISDQIKALVNKGFDIKVFNKWLSDKEISNLVKISDFLICNNKNDTLTSGIPHLCESGQKLIYSDINNDYLNEIAKSYLIHLVELEQYSKHEKCYETLKEFFKSNNLNEVGNRLKEIIS